MNKYKKERDVNQMMNNSQSSEIPMISNIDQLKKKNINTLNVSIQDSDNEESEQ